MIQGPSQGTLSRSIKVAPSWESNRLPIELIVVPKRPLQRHDTQQHNDAQHNNK